MLSLTLLWPFARELFRFGPLHVDDLAVTLGAGIVVLVFLEVLKLVYTRWRQGQFHDAGVLDLPR
jgi:Ca2+-transporting ATPase